MDAWQFVVVTGLFVAAGKWYTSCQMHYWASSECSGDWNPPAGAATTPIRGYRKRRSTDMLDVTYAAVVLVFFWTGLLYVRLAGRL